MVKAPGPRLKMENYDEALSQGPWVEALCIGVDAYKHLPTLHNAVADATALANEIQGKGSLLHVTCCTCSSKNLCLFPALPQHLTCSGIQVFQERHGAADHNRCPCARIQTKRC